MCVKTKDAHHQWVMIYLIGQNISTPSQNYHNFVRFLSDFCIKILDKIFDGHIHSSDKTFDAKPIFRQFSLTEFCPIRYSRTDSINENLSRTTLLITRLVIKNHFYWTKPFLLNSRQHQKNMDIRLLHFEWKIFWNHYTLRYLIDGG